MTVQVIQGPIHRLAEQALRVPSDKSLTQRVLLLGGVGDGVTRLQQPLDGADSRAVAGALEQLGATVERREDVWHVTGTGGNLQSPSRPLDLANSGTGARLLLGLLAGQGVAAEVTGDASLRQRPMARVLEPLERMGARFLAADRDRLPIRVVPAAPLRPFRGVLAVPSAQVKSAILLAALGAAGETVLEEPVPTRDHTELLLPRFGVPVRRRGAQLRLSGPASLVAPGPLRIPADPSSAAFFAFLAALLPGAEVTLTEVLDNPRRGAWMDHLRAAGAVLERVPEAAATPAAEPGATVRVRGGPLRAVDVAGPAVAALIDELPLLAVLATRAEGRTCVRDAGELRHKESDRIAAMVEGLGRMGARIQARADGFEIEGPCALHGATVSSHGDHRVAMALAVAGLVARGRTHIEGAGCVPVSYPGFFRDLSLLAPGAVRPGP